MTIEKIIRNIIYEYIKENKEIKNITYSVKIKNDEFFKTPVVYVNANVDGILAGTIKISRVRVKYGKTLAETLPRCIKNIDVLKSMGYEANSYWFVAGVNVHQKFRGFGIGIGLYKKMLETIKALEEGPHIVMPGYCVDGETTTQSARFVWDSISKDYTSSGHVIYLS